MFLFSSMEAGLSAEVTEDIEIENKLRWRPLGDDPSSLTAMTLRHPGTHEQYQRVSLGRELSFMIIGGQGECLFRRLCTGNSHSFIHSFPHSFHSFCMHAGMYMCEYTHVMKHI